MGALTEQLEEAGNRVSGLPLHRPLPLPSSLAFMQLDSQQGLAVQYCKHLNDCLQGVAYMLHCANQSQSCCT